MGAVKFLEFASVQSVERLSCVYLRRLNLLFLS
jgi:hypothetical protein